MILLHFQKHKFGSSLGSKVPTIDLEINLNCNNKSCIYSYAPRKGSVQSRLPTFNKTVCCYASDSFYLLPGRVRVEYCVRTISHSLR